MTAPSTPPADGWRHPWQRWDHFWMENEVLRVRLTTLRVVFFGLLAFDMWLLMLPHSVRVGADGFNVSHIPLLDAVLPVPSPALVGVLYLLGGFLAMRVAIGTATRSSLALLAGIYGGIYFWSQSDSYQHHYLIAMMLVLLWFLPLESMPGYDNPQGDGGRGARIRSWAARLIYVEISVVYFYTAVTKTTTYWLDGWALERIIQTPGMRSFLASVTQSLGTEEMAAYAFTAHAIMIWQYFVAGAFLVPKLRPLACITGPLFHILVEVIDLKIGWFSFYMIGLYYILLFPDAWFLAVARPVGRQLRRLLPLWERLVRPGVSAPSDRVLHAVLAGLVVAIVVPLAVPIEGSPVLGLLLAAVVATSLWPREGLPRARSLVRAGVQVGVVLLMCVSLRVTPALFDYHRFWAGDLNRRGYSVEAAEHYEMANALGSGTARFFQLGELYERMGRSEDARRAYRQGLARAPENERGLRGLERLGVAPRAKGPVARIRRGQ